MDRCQHCQAQLLDYLYDLLDEADQLALETHLAGCGACQNGLARARRQQDLLASAARLACAPVHFEMPAPLPETEPAVLPLPVRPGRPPRRFWRPAVAAAAALLVLVGAGLYFHADQIAARQAVARHQEQMQDGSAELAAVFQKQEAIEKQSAAGRKALASREREEELLVQVTGPQVLAGPGTAPFRIETTDLDGKPLDAAVRAKLVRRDVASKDQEVTLERDAADKTRFQVPDKANLDPTGDYELVVHADRPGGNSGGASLAVPVPVEVAAPQVVTYLTTDRPLYQAGTDVVYFRSLTLDRRTLRPVPEELILQYVLRLPGGREMLLAQGVDRLRRAGADETILRGPDNEPLRGIGAGSVPLDATLPAGEYTLAVRELRGRIPETRTRFLVRKEGAVRLENGWQWHRSEYNPGQELLASGKLVRATGEPLRGKLVTVSLVSAGRVLAPTQMLTTDGAGLLRLQSRLPADLDGPATLVLSLQEGAAHDEIRAAVPVHLPGAVVEFYPEGGDLVAGLESRVYFQARDRRGQPVVLSGDLLENGRPTGIAVHSVRVPELGPNSGLGSFCFTPKPGARYTVRVAAPADTAPLALPAVQAEGVVLTVAEPVHATPLTAGQPLAFRVRCNGVAPRPLQVTLTCRGQVLEVVRLQPGQTQGAFLNRAARGVCRVTVHEEMNLQGHILPGPVLAAALAGRADGPLAAATTMLAGAWRKTEEIPRAERLVFCQPAERLDIDLRADRLAYKAGETARVQFSALDELRRNVPAVAQVAIVDRAALRGVDEKLARSLPAQAWLAAELRSPELLERADALLLPASASRQALDLVLATQGWRRFATATELPLTPDEERLVTVQGRRVPDYSTLARDRAALEAATAAQRAVLAERATRLTAALDEMKDDREAAAQARLTWYEENGAKLRRGLLLALGTLLVVLVLVVLGQLLLAELRRAPTWLALAGTCAAVLLLGLTVTPPPPLAFEQASLPVRVVAQVEPKQPPHKARKSTPWGVWMTDKLALPEAAKKPAEPRGNFGAGGKNGLQDDRPETGNHLEEKGKKAMAPRTFAGAFGRGGFGGGQGGTASRDEDRVGVPTLEKADRFQNQAKAAGGPGALARFNADKQTESPAVQLRRELEAESKKEQAVPLKDANQQLRNLAEQERQLRERALVVRQWPRTFRKLADGESDLDGTPTVFWHPVLILPGAGTTIEFRLGATPTRYRIDVQAHSLDGRVGNVRKDLDTTSAASK